MIKCNSQTCEQTVLSLPDWCDMNKENRTIGVDPCLVDIILALWSINIETLGNCCGHGKRNPSIVLGHTCTKDEIKYAYFMIKTHFMEIDLMQWSGSILEIK